MARNQDIDDATDAQWAVAARREEVIAKLAPMDGIRRLEVDTAAKILGLSRAMIYRLLARYREDSRTSALLAETVGRRQGSLSLHRRVEAIITQNIENFFLKPERPSAAALHKLVFAECKKADVKPPSYNSIRARIDSFDIEKVVHSRFVAKAAHGRFRPVQAEGLRPNPPWICFRLTIHRSMSSLSTKLIDCPSAGLG